MVVAYLLKRSKTLASSETTNVSSVSKSAKSKAPASVDELTAANAVTNLAETAGAFGLVTCASLKLH